MVRKGSSRSAVEQGCDDDGSDDEVDDDGDGATAAAKSLEGLLLPVVLVSPRGGEWPVSDAEGFSEA